MRSDDVTEFDSVIVRFGGEIGVKGEWTRRRYEGLLLRNIRDTLKHCNLVCKIARERGRIYVESRDSQKIAGKLTRIFGISSVSPAKQTTSDIKAIAKTSVDLATDIMEDKSTFAVRCHRVGTHAYSSMDVCKQVGRQILTGLRSRNLHVNLTNPQFTISVEARDTNAYVYLETLLGPGGFPVGSQAKVVSLLSGGIDSPVASWLAMKRGCPIIPIYLDNTPLTDESTTARAFDTAKKLFEWSIDFPRKMYIVPNGRNLQVLVKKAPRKLTCLLCKRIMYRIAERIADMEKAEGIVTGEAIGEQASQTVTNLRVLDEVAVKYPIHRPLLGFDKTETEQLARRIGTFEISTRKAKDCTAASSHPATRAKLQIVKEAEEKLDIEQIIDESVKAARAFMI